MISACQQSKWLQKGDETAQREARWASGGDFKQLGGKWSLRRKVSSQGYEIRQDQAGQSAPVAASNEGHGGAHQVSLTVTAVIS